MTLSPGDRVRMAALGKGVVREVRNHGRYLVEVKGRAMVVDGSLLEREDARPPRRAKAEPPAPVAPVSGRPSPGGRATSIDLHGRTVPEALEVLDTFLNAALLDGAAEVRIIHGRSGGRLKAAVHGRLKAIAAVRAFRLDPANAGVTVVFL